MVACKTFEAFLFTSTLSFNLTNVVSQKKSS
uniref:Uncharacterized protein n=1 Tax=Arundo donax TaxID=35708 RepID=A0A0A9AG64_ARUDO